MKPLPRTYDAVFEAELSVPVEFARALAWNESGMNPRNKTGSYWGLFQVGPENVADYNRANGTTFTHDDMLDPQANARVWSWESERIRAMLAAHGLVEDWNSRDYVSLVTAGWNSGWSNTAGVGYMLGWLRAHKLPLTHDNVFKYGKQAGAVWSLQSGNSKAAAKYRWQRDTAAYYAAERAAAGDGNILGNLAHWATKRIPVETLRPPGTATSAPLVASQATPLPEPSAAQGAVAGKGGGMLWLLLFGLVAMED